MLRFLVLSSFLLLSTSVLADCLSVAESGFDIEEGEVGAGELHWHALIDNRCNLDQDAMLTVEFLDAAGEAVYEVQDQLVVERRGQAQAGRRIYVPAMYIDQIEGLRLRLEARERPF